MKIVIVIENFIIFVELDINASIEYSHSRLVVNRSCGLEAVDVIDKLYSDDFLDKAGLTIAVKIKQIRHS